MLDRRWPWLALAALGATGCSDTPRSCDLDTASIVLRATVSDLESGVEVEIELEAAREDGSTELSGTALELCSDSDRLEVDGVETEEVHALGHRYYIAEFSSPSSSYTITLTRKDHEDVSVTVEMPPSFEITAPAEGTELSRAALLEIDWMPGWDGHSIVLEAADQIGSTCIEGLGFESEVDDTGSYAIAGSTLVGGAAGVRCNVTISMTRVLEAEPPSAVAAGSSVTALVRRRRPFVSIE